MRKGTLIAAISGLGLGAIIVAYFGADVVLGTVERVGCGGFALVIAYRLAGYLPLGMSWWLIEPSRRHQLIPFVRGRLVRDAVGDILPLSQLGGYLGGARALTVMGVPAPVAAATTVVDLTLELLAKLVYTVLGILLLAHLHPRSPLVLPAMVGVCVGLAVVLAFVFVQRRGTADLERVSLRLGAKFLPGITGGSSPSVAEILDQAYARPCALAVAAGVHLLSWISDGVGAWIALHLMGVPLGIPAVLSLESLLHAVRSIAFAVPNAAGVQEGAYVMLGHIFGLAPDTALALSLLKRGRDILIGMPVLFDWQWLESGSRRRRTAERL